MVRNVLGILVGYFAMALIVFATFSITYLIIGPEGAFQPGSYTVSGLWLAISFLLGLVAAVAGGFICAAIARNSKASFVLAGLVLALGILIAVPILLTPEDAAVQAREGSVGNFEAMQKAKQPGWVAITNPFVGALGVILGARLKREDRK